MKMSKENQKEMLLDSFELLNESYYENSSAIADIVSKMFKVDVNTAVEMWEFLLNKHAKMVVNQNDCFPLTEQIVRDGIRGIGVSEFAEIVLSHPFIKKNVFELSGSVWWTTKIIEAMFISNQVPLANDLLEILNNNSNKVESVYSILEEVISELYNINEEALECLMSWIDRVENKHEKTKLNLRMLEFLDE